MADQITAEGRNPSASSAATPRVSLGLPVYNGERFLGACLDSLLTQTFSDFEIIISDNASTDRTESICREYASRDTRIRYVRQPSNLGVNKNFNLLIDHATAPFFKWASADDLIAPNLLERCLDVIENDASIVLVHPRTQFIDADGQLLPQDEPGLHLMGETPSERFTELWDKLSFCNAQYGLMRIDVLRQMPVFGAFVGADICFLAELALHGKFYEIPDRLLFRRFHREASGSLTAEQLLTYYGISKGSLVLYYWRQFYEQAMLIDRAPISLAEKLRALQLVARRTIGHRHVLRRELGFLVNHLTGRPYPILGSIERFSRPAPGRTPLAASHRSRESS